MSSDDVIVEATSPFEVSLTAGLRTIEPSLLPDSGADLVRIQHEEANIRLEDAMVESVMAILRLQMFEGFGAVRTGKVAGVVRLPVPVQLALADERLPADVSLDPHQLHMNPLLVLAEIFEPISLKITLVT